MNVFVILIIYGFNLKYSPWSTCILFQALYIVSLHFHSQQSQVSSAVCHWESTCSMRVIFLETQCISMNKSLSYMIYIYTYIYISVIKSRNCFVIRHSEPGNTFYLKPFWQGLSNPINELRNTGGPGLYYSHTTHLLRHPATG